MGEKIIVPEGAFSALPNFSGGRPYIRIPGGWTRVIRSLRASRVTTHRHIARRFNVIMSLAG
jgi:hypothetical protein